MKKQLLRQGTRMLNRLPESLQTLALPLKVKYQFKKSEKILNISPSLRKKRSSGFQKEILAYWKKHLNIHINPAWHFIYANFTGIEDVRFLPHTVWMAYIHSVLNNPIYQYPTFRDKNFTDFVVDKKYLPKTVFKVVRGRFYDDENRPITRDEAFFRLVSDKNEKIMKPSLGFKGMGVEKLKIQNRSAYLHDQKVTADLLLKTTGEDAIVQQKVEQHAALSAPHPYSVNSVRINTIRVNNEIHDLLHLLKLGAGKEITDNAKQGYLIGLNNDGTINSKTYDRKFNTAEIHPTTGYEFNKIKKVPGFPEAIELCKSLHEKVIHLDFAGWDVAISKDGTPIILEVNSCPPAIQYQFINKQPFFGDYTEEVLRFVRRQAKQAEPLIKAQN
jgi:hypothetical protein